MEELVVYITNNTLISVAVISVVSTTLFIMFVGDDD